jgi:hypothetical protein
MVSNCESMVPITTIAGTGILPYWYLNSEIISPREKQMEPFGASKNDRYQQGYAKRLQG